MRTSPTLCLVSSIAACALVLAASATARAQTPPSPSGAAPAAPPGFAPAPGYAPAPQYAPPPGYAYPPPALPERPKTLDYEDGDPVPAGYHARTKTRKGLLIGGAVMFGCTYLISATVAASFDKTTRQADFQPLYIPAAGPFITISSASSYGLGTFALVIDGLAQAGGLAMAVAGIAAKKTELVRDDVGMTHFMVAPVVTRESVGFGVAGTL